MRFAGPLVGHYSARLPAAGSAKLSRKLQRDTYGVVSAERSSKRKLSFGSILMWGGVALVLAVTLRGVLNERKHATTPAVASASAAPAARASIPAEAAADPSTRPAPASGEAAKALLARRCPNHADCSCTRKLIDELLVTSSVALALAAVELGGGACGENPGLSDLRAEALAREGDWATARQLAQPLLLEHSDNPWAAYALARVALLQNDLEGAASAAARAVKLGRPAAHAIAAQVLLKQGKHDAALEELKQALEANDRDVEAHYFVGIVERGRQHYRPAREAFLAALRSNPSFADARYQLGELAHSAGAFDEARHHLQRLAAITTADDPRVEALSAKLKGGGKQPSPVYSTSRVAK